MPFPTSAQSGIYGGISDQNKLINVRQTDIVFAEIIPQQKLDYKTQSVGIISPFRLQADEFKKTKGGIYSLVSL